MSPMTNDQDALLLLREMLSYAQLLVDEHPDITRMELAHRLVERFSPSPVASGSHVVVAEGRRR